MSGIPTNDSTQQGTSYGGYSNWGYHASDRGIINVNPPFHALDELRKHCSHSAAFDSSERYDPPRCTESTRLAIIRNIEEWIQRDEDNATSPSVFWLYGGAGVGKSALAQSISEKFQQNKQLAASFFFFRGDSSRNNGKLLIPTLASHLVDTFKEIIPFVEDRIRDNPALFTKRYQVQIQELLVKPLLALKSTGTLITHPRLIVIDGLDECDNPDIQAELLRVIARAILEIPYSFRFFITSRPEAHITRVFNHDRDLQAIKVHSYNLSDDRDGDVDIRKFLETEFAEIRRSHPVGQHLPYSWPDDRAITSIVDRSSGHFIYASTVIRFIQSPRHRPDDRLEVILRLRPPQEGDRPYDQLDALYALIFMGVESRGDLEKICLVLGVVYFHSQDVGIFRMVRYITIEVLLNMKAGDLVLLLNPILSLIAINGDAVRILHKSLFDYLLDGTRSRHLPFDLARVHEYAATYILEQRIAKNMCVREDFRDFAYHCQFAYLNDPLKDYLHSLEIPCPKSIVVMPKSFPLWDDGLNRYLRSIIWPFLRTLSRKDFDSTQVYGKYMADWTQYLCSVVPKRIRHPSRDAHTTAIDLKCTLDTLLRDWKPRDSSVGTVNASKRASKRRLGFRTLFKGKKSHSMDKEEDPRVALIKQEHDVFSAFTNAAFFANAVIVSSLVIGDYFIHSYNFGIRDDMVKFLILRTYSRHADTHCQHVREGAFDIAQETRTFLGMRLEKYLFSDLYQKYGVTNL